MRNDPIKPCPFCGEHLRDEAEIPGDDWEGYFVHPVVTGCPLSGAEFNTMPEFWNGKEGKRY